MEKLLTCRKCHKVFTAKTEEEGITWYSRSRGYNYHMECWKELTDNSKTKTEDEWIDLIFDLITREIQGNYAFFRIKAQIDGFIKNGMTVYCRSTPESYNNPKGEQVLIREYLDKQLVIAHRFADSKDIDESFLEGKKVIAQYGAIDCDFSAKAWILKR